MNNSDTSTVIIYGTIENKVTKGNESEAQAQLFTWFQGATIRIRKLLKKIGNGTPTPNQTLPLIGWTTIGERWEMYMAVGNGNREEDSVLVLGPFPTCYCNTSTSIGAFRLLRLMERVKVWARATYWIWLKNVVIEPLKGMKGLPLTVEEVTEEAVDASDQE